MKQLAATFAMMALVAACGGGAETGSTAMADEASDSGDVDYCSCVTEPIRNNARAQACKTLIDSMDTMEAIEAGLVCREKPPEGGPDLCFCVQTSSRDPEILAACEAILPENPTRTQLASLFAECAQKSR